MAKGISGFISIHAPRVGRDPNFSLFCIEERISIHAPRVGRDLRAVGIRNCDDDFNPRAPRGARLQDSTIATTSDAFQSTRPAWGATWRMCAVQVGIAISIHAPRVGRDGLSMPKSAYLLYFNPRAPRGARPQLVATLLEGIAFQSTRPAWGATRSQELRRCQHMISIHAPRVGRDKSRRKCWARSSHFNPRAPRGARPWPPWDCGRCPGFQSTRPAWGATKRREEQRRADEISIHAPRVGRDRRGLRPRRTHNNFNPRAPTPAGRRAGFQSTRPALGATPAALVEIGFLSFQSTRPAWGATADFIRGTKSAQISIHAPRVGRDLDQSVGVELVQDFNPRAPRGARPSVSVLSSTSLLFQSTRPAWGATRGALLFAARRTISIHAPRVGRDAMFRSSRPRSMISIHAPRVGRD